MNPISKETQQNQDTQIQTETDLKSINDTIKKMADRLIELEKIVKNHNHTGQDGTGVISSTIDLKPSELIQLGNFRIEERSDVPTANYQIGYLVVGKDKEDQIASQNTQISLQHRNSTNGSTNQSFFDGQRYPLFQGIRASVTSGTSVCTVSDANFDTNELTGAQIIVVDSAGNPYSKQIVSNSPTKITIQGTWPTTITNAGWTVLMPVYLGSSVSPWRMLYAGGDSVANNGSQRRAIRLGYGPTSDQQAIFFGSGSPESVVTAVVGSLYLRSDGGATTTLYIKTSGTGNTGWTNK